MKFNVSKKKLLAIGLIAGGITAGAWYFLPSTKESHPISYATMAPDEIKGSIITLKKLKEEYFIDYHNMYSNVVREAFEAPRHITLDYTIRNLRRHMDQMFSGEALFYCIFDNKDNRLVGGIEIRQHNEFDNGQLGCWLNEQYWGGGRIQEALKLINHAYFALKPDEQSYIAHVRLWNKRSYHALKKAGFTELGYINEDGKPSRHLLQYARK